MKGNRMKKNLRLPAVTENLEQVLEFTEYYLTKAGCAMKTLMQFQIAVEEIFVNIAHYAYENEVGDVMIKFQSVGKPPCVSITFVDRGKPYNPMEREDPDITLSSEERQIGGLGIYMVKKSMDSMTYEYRRKRNILTITKTI